MDFSTLTAITIPEGSVTKITDASGNVLWQQGYTYTVYDDNSHYLYGPSTLDISDTSAGIDLGIIYDSNMYIGIKAKFRLSGSYFWDKLIGTAEDSGFALQIYSANSYKNGLRMYFGNSASYATAGYGSSKNNWKENVDIGLGLGSRGYNGALAYYIWNTGTSSPSWALINSYNYTSYTSKQTIHVFGYNNSNTSPNWGVAHVYIYQHDSTHTGLTDGQIMELYPCKRSDGICGLYDKLNDKFYSGAYKPEEWTIV